MDNIRDPRLAALEHIAANPSPMTHLMVSSLLAHLADEDEDAFQKALTILDEEEARWP